MIYSLYRNAIKEVVTVVNCKNPRGHDRITLIMNECDAAVDRAYNRWVAETKIINIHSREIKEKYYDALCVAVVDRTESYL